MQDEGYCTVVTGRTAISRPGCLPTTVSTDCPSRSRYPRILDTTAHSHLGDEPVRHLLHPGRPRALLDRRVRGLLHQLTTLHVLPFHGLQRRPSDRIESDGTHTDLVPTVLVLRDAGSWGTGPTGE